MKRLTYYISAIQQLPHILPLYERFKGTIFTTDLVTYKWLEKYDVVRNFVHIGSMCDIAGVEAILVGDYYHFPKVPIRIQLFHGYSKKAYINQLPQHWYSHIISCSPFFNLNTPYHGFSRYKRYPLPQVSANPKEILFCPTYKVNSLPDLDIKSVKFHPLDYYNKSPIIDTAKKRGFNVVDILDEDYVRYERLFNTHDSILTDTSSIGYEFSLTGKPVFVDDLNHRLPTMDYFYDNDIFDLMESIIQK